MVNRVKKSIHHSLFTIHLKVKQGFTLIELLIACNPKPWRRKAIQGFTLIELLIVITILGILAGVALVSFGGAQERSRDSRRKTDLDAIKKALELKKQDSTGAYYYSNDLASLATTYIKVVPTDPKTGANYIYTPTPSGCTSTNNCTSYSLVACLENANDNQKDATKNAACTTASYTITPN